MAESEHSIQSKIEIDLSKHGCSVFRANVGKTRTPDGRFFSTGLPKGFTDLFGTRWVDGKSFYIEVKDTTGKPSEAQIRFHHMLASHNIIHGIARSVEDARMIALKGEVGYGFHN